MFGAGSDLQIYHDGSNSRIYDTGTGALVMRSNQLNIQSPSGEKLAIFNQDDDVELYYNDSKKLSTTSTGIDVTGAVTADSFTSSGQIQITGANVATILLNEADQTDKNHRIRQNGGNLAFQKVSDDGATVTSNLLINSGGDISFYSSDGTSQSLFWDASAESLGIGTTSPDRVFHVSRSSASVISGKFESASTSGSHIVFKDADTTTNDLQVRIGSDANDLVQYAGGSERLRITSSGQVGIGCTPSRNLDIQGTGDTLVSIVSPAANQAALFFGDTDSDSVGRVAYDNSDNSMRLSTNGSERMRINSSGNVGIGVVPEAWNSGLDALQIGLGASIAGNTSNPSRTYINANAYINTSNVESYVATDEASQYFQNAGTHTFKVAPSGAADTAISWTTAMTVDNSGRVGIGVAAPYSRLQVLDEARVSSASNSAGKLALGDGGTGNDNVGIWRGAANSVSDGNWLNLGGWGDSGITFSVGSAVFGSKTERMRIDL